MDKKGMRLFLLIIVSIWIFLMAIIELIRFCVSIFSAFIKNLIIIKKPIEEK